MPGISIKDIDLRAPSIISLIAVNVILLAMAILLDWSIFDVVVVFWVENLVIGFYNLIKIGFADGNEANKSGKDDAPPGCMKIFLIPFFMMHFFGFCLVHGLFLIILFSGQAEGFSGNIFALYGEIFQSNAVIFGLIGMIISHGISFFTNYLGKKEYLYIGIKKQMMAPYKRIVVIHIFIIVAGYLIISSGKDAVLIMILFFVIKMVFDLRQHILEHKGQTSIEG